LLQELSKGSGVGMFAVFDGHGGQEVAKFASKYMPSEFQKILAEKKGDFEATLPLAFHRIDTSMSAVSISSGEQFSSANKSVQERFICANN
jgi:serine/threonine protein phosphatase PrpC